MPVAQNVWQHVDAGRPAADARHLIIASTTRPRQRPTVQAARPIDALKQWRAFASSTSPATGYASMAASFLLGRWLR